MLYFINILIFLFLVVFYYFVPLKEVEYYSIFLTISTFIFSIFTGFFIARQGNRYSSIREQITNFDGAMSGMYRQFGHLGVISQNEVKKIIKNHYDKIIKNNAWDYHFVNKSSTITSIHLLVEKTVKNKKLVSLKNLALQRIFVSLAQLQIIRKKMIAMHHERIPKFQWMLLYFLAFILFLTLSIIPSYNFLLGAILKSAFGSSVIFIFILLRKFDRLEFFEKTIGEESAQDILDIFAGKK